MKLYCKNDLAGCVQQQRARSTGSLVGVYNNAQADMCQEAGPWSTVCEKHNTIAGHPALSLAREMAGCPEEWCDTCQLEQTTG